MNALAWIYLIELALGTLAGWLFIIGYSFTYHWWHSSVATHVVSFSTVVAAFYTLYFFRTLAQPGTASGSTAGGFGVFRFILFTLLTAVVMWRLIVFIPERLRREHRENVVEPKRKD
jgi:hypothetical protein